MFPLSSFTGTMTIFYQNWGVKFIKKKNICLVCNSRQYIVVLCNYFVLHWYVIKDSNNDAIETLPHNKNLVYHKWVLKVCMPIILLYCYAYHCSWFLLRCYETNLWNTQYASDVILNILFVSYVRICLFLLALRFAEDDYPPRGCHQFVAKNNSYWELLEFIFIFSLRNDFRRWITRTLWK